jgi:hypothetical protein
VQESVLPAVRNIYSVSPGERPTLVRQTVYVTEQVIFVANDLNDPFVLVAAESEARAYEIGAPLLMPD